jgi:RNA exonuclease 4
MVGVGSSKATALARVTLVDGGTGAVLLDTHVRPATEVTDYRTRWSGVLPHHLRGAPSMETVVPVVQNVIQGKIVVGHGLKNDFDALGLPLPPRHLLRDTSLFKAFRTATSAVEKKTRPRKLKTLALEELGLVIQQGKMGHSSVEDAKAALALYLKVKEKWDRSSQQQQ